MNIKIWSDVVCPFCYIGKRNLERALAAYNTQEPVDIEWKSFMLNPNLKTQVAKSLQSYLVESKGWTMDYVTQMNARVNQMANAVGLEYHLDKAVVANSFDAHRLIQMAKTRGLGDAMEESLFSAYFCEGKNIDDHTVLISLAQAIGLDDAEVTAMLKRNDFAQDVQRDIQESQHIGVRGVPLFLINDQIMISGAQPEAVFLDAFQKAAEV